MRPPTPVGWLDGPTIDIFSKQHVKLVCGHPNKGITIRRFLLLFCYLSCCPASFTPYRFTTSRRPQYTLTMASSETNASLSPTKDEQALEDSKRSTTTTPSGHKKSSSNSSLRNADGWDGKLRVEKKQAVLVNPEVLEGAVSDPEDSEEDDPLVEKIEADEDLLADVNDDEEEIDLVHCRIQSIQPLKLDRFNALRRLCLRQNQISDTEDAFPSNLAPTLTELDLYDNLIAHIRGFEELKELTSLDLSFNKIKHIKRLSNLKKLTDLYFVQNKISTIEGLEGLDQLKNLELGGNRIREIQGLDTLSNLKELWLGKNKITELKVCTPSYTIYYTRANKCQGPRQARQPNNPLHPSKPPPHHRRSLRPHQPGRTPHFPQRSNLTLRPLI
jgi:Leucine-rich repeat (LRR) protein